MNYIPVKPILSTIISNKYLNDPIFIDMDFVLLISNIIK